MLKKNKRKGGLIELFKKQTLKGGKLYDCWPQNQLIDYFNLIALDAAGECTGKDVCR